VTREQDFERLLAIETDDCVLWPFAKNSHGYGYVFSGGQMRRTHVLACVNAHGARPERHDAAHSCRVRLCMNPRHLRWATRSENMADNEAFGTLTEPQVRAVRRRYPAETQAALAAEFGISQQAISSIIRGRSWSWIDTEDLAASAA
jgi:DNA-binding XRE family transcriptional regulator